MEMKSSGGLIKYMRLHKQLCLGHMNSNETLQYRLYCCKQQMCDCNQWFQTVFFNIC